MSQSYITATNLKLRLNLGGAAGTAVIDDDTLLAQYVSSTNDWIEHETWRPIGPTAGGTATFDGAEDVSNDGRTLFVQQGVRTITSIEVAPSTGATAVAGTAADFVILPRPQNRRTGWPGFEVRVKDAVTGNVSIFPTAGYGEIVIVGDFGWESIPSNLSELGYRVAIRAWHARNAGQVDIIGSDETGAPIVSRFASAMDWKILKSFRPAGGLTVG